MEKDIIIYIFFKTSSAINWEIMESQQVITDEPQFGPQIIQTPYVICQGCHGSYMQNVI